jgi:hypothetical protein
VSVIVCCVAMQIEIRTDIRAERHRARIGQERVTEPVRIEVMTEARSAACVVVSTGHVQGVASD